MSDLRPVRWIPASAQKAVVETVDAALAAWAVHWGFSAPGPAQATVLHSRLEGARLGDVLAAAFGESAAWRNAMYDAILGVDDVESSVVDRLIVQITQDLQNRLAQLFGAEVPATAKGVPFGHWGLRLDLSMLGVRGTLDVSLDQLVASGVRLVPDRRALRRVPAESALAEAAVPLVAELASLPLTAGELMGLTVGDVLLLDAPLKRDLRVSSPRTELSLWAQLGAVQDPPRRALRWRRMAATAT